MSVIIIFTWRKTANAFWSEMSIFLCIRSENSVKDVLLIFRYVDYTGDIQTATILLVVGRCFVKEQSWPIAYSAEEIASSDFELLTIEDSGACTKL